MKGPVMVLCTDCMLVFPRSHSAQLCRQLFLCADRSPRHLSKRRQGLSQVVVHMSADDVAANNDVFHIF